MNNSGIDNIHILVVDDEEAIRDMLKQAIQNAGYTCSIAGSGEEALRVLASLYIDVVVTDIKMPGMSGIDLISRVKEKYDSDVIVMTGFIEDFTYEKIIERGASDFVYKPFSPKELIVRLKRVLRERSLLKERNQAHLQLQVAHIELQDAYRDTITRLVMAAEYKDEDTGDHIVRMSRYSELIAKKLNLPDKDVECTLYAAPMHDVGKIGIPDSILLKPGALTREEFEIMKTHTTIGASILSNSKSKVLKLGHDIALSHHERWDGSGYPYGLIKEEISLFGRIVGIVDAFDALTSMRPYKDPYPIEVALDIIKKEREKHFDPEITDVFLDNIDEILEIKESVGIVHDITIKNFQWSERDQDIWGKNQVLSIE